MKMLRITLQGKTYEVGVEVLDTASGSTVAAPVAAPVAPVAVAAPAPAVAAPAPAPVAAPAAPAPAVAGSHPVTSPMPGTVMKITTAVGQHVTKDQELLILEAMKMETEIRAAQAGTVRGIAVKSGDAVSVGDTLMTLA